MVRMMCLPAFLLVACSGDGTDDTAPMGDTAAVDTDLVPADVCINEYMASNRDAYVLKDKTAPDWIELHNPTDHEISLNGWTITDDGEDPAKVALDGHVIPANGFLLLFADGDPEDGPDHLSFKLSASGEQIGIFAPDGRGELITYGPMAEDFSFARSPDCCQEDDCWVFSSGGTPGASNVVP